MEPRDYLQELRKSRILTPKRSKCIDKVTLYTMNGNVYCIVLKAYDNAPPRVMKKAGLVTQCTIITDGLPESCKLVSKVPDYRADHDAIDISKGRYQLAYDTKTTKISIFSLE